MYLSHSQTPAACSQFLPLPPPPLPTMTSPTPLQERFPPLVMPSDLQETKRRSSSSPQSLMVPGFDCFYYSATRRTHTAPSGPASRSCVDVHYPSAPPSPRSAACCFIDSLITWMSPACGFSLGLALCRPYSTAGSGSALLWAEYPYL